MPLEVMHFRDSDKIIKDKHMERDVKGTLEYIEESLYGTLYKREILRQVLDEMHWREKVNLNILDGRRYRYKGFKRGVAIEGNFSAYEFILEGLFRLQVGFDKGILETGILLLTSKRSEKTPYGSTKKMVKKEIDMLYPTISMPVTIALYDLGEPIIPGYEEEGGDNHGISV